MGRVDREWAWEGLEELRPALRDTLSRRCRDASEVDDVIQETFLRAARYRNSVHDVRNLKAWVMRIALNVLADCVRRETRLQRAPLGEELLDDLPCTRVAEEAWPASYEVRCGNWLLDGERALHFLSGALVGLQPEERRLINAFYRERRGGPGTARHCAIPRHLVKVRLFRARRRLRRLLHRHASTGAGRFAGSLETSAAPAAALLRASGADR